MTLKAILSDFDGTLVDKDNKYNLEVKELLNFIKSKGIRFSVATGRGFYSGIHNVLEELQLFDYHICNGGALIMHNKSRKILWEQAIPSDSARKIKDYLIKTRINFAFESVNYTYVNKKVDFPNYADKKSMRSLTDLNDFSDVLKVLIFGYLNNLSEGDVEKHKKKLSRLCNDISLIKFKFADRFGMDITSIKATKHTAVLEYEKLLEIPRDQIVGMGDGYNDYPLLTACGYKIAMGNAPKELKEIADFIAPSVENNGTIVALQHIIKKFNL
ncbi:hypothetical protein A2774_05790 [Candidatus Roizmanbacteria bacterium RIFCSPHIGHO2_01_FULL_39_12c]|uniref:Cof-like hydrolase n=1 Tax=Candidatus Roizmanbacteria bacterium RIFCSPHIGHO2_01_FULL_39_12c TaxID=1802031 RepID=A0A1F7GC57_9BACT|nr:MAG: hypothetical protein A2774_05790 [Candidatus Roizmanbacteria bacterium RIFCSPHIGHO2_01_FULL_39_12c]OGK47763.1 MAG: hypothetical protein A2963_02800 [Candidatus Roizmanbacteria bacterium RIFCSPLOWO2_01_FULL_40_13]